MTMAREIAEFAARVSYDMLSERARLYLKLLVLDAIGCAIGSLGSESIGFLRAQTEDFGGASHCVLIGGGKTSPDRAGPRCRALCGHPA